MFYCVLSLSRLGVIRHSLRLGHYVFYVFFHFLALQSCDIPYDKGSMCSMYSFPFLALQSCGIPYDKGIMCFMCSFPFLTLSYAPFLFICIVYVVICILCSMIQFLSSCCESKNDIVTGVPCYELYSVFHPLVRPQLFQVRYIKILFLADHEC